MLRPPAPEGVPPPPLPDGPLPPHELAERDDLGREAAAGAEAAPLGLDPLRGVGAEGQHDLGRRELLEVAAVLGAGDEGVLRPPQEDVRGALRACVCVCVFFVAGFWLEQLLCLLHACCMCVGVCGRVFACNRKVCHRMTNKINNTRTIAPMCFVVCIGDRATLWVARSDRCKRLGWSRGLGLTTCTAGL